MPADHVEELQAMLVAAEEAHGTYEATELNGAYDKDWARWYAVYAVAHGIGALVGREVTMDQLAEFLAVSYADFKQLEPGAGEPWSTYTARRIAADLSDKRFME